MKDEDAMQIAEAFVRPVKALLEKVVTILERLTARVEVLELERLHQHESRYDEKD